MRSKGPPLSSFALAILGSSAACDDDPGVAEGIAQEQVGPDGGLVSSADGVLSISIRPGALREPVVVTVEPSDEAPPVFGPVYRVRPDIDLRVPAVVTYRHMLPADPESGNIGVVLREDFETGMGQWIVLPVLGREVDAETIFASDTRLSMFYGLLEGGGPEDPDAAETGETGQ